MRRELIVVETDMAKEHRQREERAAGVVDADEGRVRDDVERLLAAVVGMVAPADVAEQAGGVAQALFLRALLDAGRRHEPVGPDGELLPVARRAGAQLVELLGARDERIARTLGLAEQRIEEALAHA